MTGVIIESCDSNNIISISTSCEGVDTKDCREGRGARGAPRVMVDANLLLMHDLR